MENLEAYRHPFPIDFTYGMPLFVILIIAFIANFFLCRWLTIKLLEADYIAKHPIVDYKKSGQPIYNTTKKSEEFTKCILVWFFPIVGFCSLLVLYSTCSGVRFYKRISRSIFLTHI